MRIVSIFRVATLALGLTATAVSIGSAFAASEAVAAVPQAQQGGSTGPYDGADFEAAKHAPT